MNIDLTYAQFLTLTFVAQRIGYENPSELIKAIAEKEIGLFREITDENVIGNDPKISCHWSKDKKTLIKEVNYTPYPLSSGVVTVTVKNS